MGLPYESPSGAGGYDDDDYSMSPDAGDSDDLSTMGYDGYQHDTSGGQAADEDDYDDDVDVIDDGHDGPSGWDAGAGRM
jgi:hypothetical protein